MGLVTMDAKDAKITARLEEVLQSIFCPVGGCWGLHGCRYDFYYDNGMESYVLEVWPVAIKEKDEHGGNGHQRSDAGLLYELAEFEFGEILKEVTLEHLHFSQQRQVFEIGWKEDDEYLELRVHIEPAEDDYGGQD
jgi:hypothetical protein